MLLLGLELILIKKLARHLCPAAHLVRQFHSFNALRCSNRQWHSDNFAHDHPLSKFFTCHRRNGGSCRSFGDSRATHRGRRSRRRGRRHGGFFSKNGNSRRHRLNPFDDVSGEQNDGFKTKHYLFEINQLLPTSYLRDSYSNTNSNYHADEDFHMSLDANGRLVGSRAKPPQTFVRYEYPYSKKRSQKSRSTQSCPQSFSRTGLFDITPVSVILYHQQRTYATLLSDNEKHYSQESVYSSRGFDKSSVEIDTVPDQMPDLESDTRTVSVLNSEKLLEKFLSSLDFNKPEEQIRLFKELAVAGKYNEMYLNFQFLTQRVSMPALEVCNMTLKSILMRRNTGESLEESLTNLLNVYSNMLNLSVKPDSETYNVVISTLFEGALTALVSLQNTDQGLQYFQVGKQLFEVCDHELTKLDDHVYELYLSCSLLFEGSNLSGASAKNFKNFINSKLGDFNVNYYIYFMKVASTYDEFVEVYNQFKLNAKTNDELCSYQFSVYEVYLQRLIESGRTDEATLLLDQLMNQLKGRKFEDTLEESGLISSYLQGISQYNVEEAHRIFLQFDSIPWLPEIQMSSLLVIIKNCLSQQNYEMLNKFWNYAVIRNDFNSVAGVGSNITLDLKDLTQLMLRPIQGDKNMIISNVIELSFGRDELNTVRLTKEVMLKDIKLARSTVAQVLQYMVQTNLSVNFIANFIVNQGHKQGTEINQFLSTIIDQVPEEIQFLLAQSGFFKRCCDSYNLINDNFYGIYRILTTTWDCKDVAVTPKLRYYYSKIYEEMNDLSNYYVEMPSELKDFKELIRLKCQDFNEH